ncbi:DUF72 domain-containing protein [Phenylobacterium sp.]|uniref:DUF72 domain-containing protein n=1 Tax=Phenylobacterium sp. TaxID=1871053 RepID=UPI00286B07D4|nr:DUF72 domain-containing protein [Phenylobacterium sp.]
MAGKGLIRAGIGGWTFEPWRGVFYPKGLKHADELNYASRRLNTLEINSTYYSSQKPETFAKWAASTPDGFVFSVKASRFATNRRVLAEGEESMRKFLTQGIVELGDRLGPILWQFMATKKFDPDDFQSFLDLLPKTLQGLALRHVVEVRHASFAVPAFVEMCRERNVAICVADHEVHPLIPDITADFVYSRLMTGSDDIETAYPDSELDAWAERFTAYSKGQVPGDLPPVDRTGPAEGPRDVFAYVIHEGKVRAPAAAQALLGRVNN